MPVEFPSDARLPPRREEHYVLEELPRGERMLFGTLAYPVFPLPLLFARWDPLVRFHVRQGIGLTILVGLAGLWAGFAWSIDAPELGWLGYVGCVLLAVIGIRNALALERKPLPILGPLAERLPFPLRLAEPPPVKLGWTSRLAAGLVLAALLLTVILRLLAALA